jgi:hypothetical protein
MDRLRQDSRVAQIGPDPTHFAALNLIRDSGRELGVDVTNLAGRLRNVSSEDISNGIDAFATAMLADSSFDPETIFPTIRARDFLNPLQDLVGKSVSVRSIVAYEELAQDSIILYQTNGDGRLSAINWSEVGAIDFDALRTIAINNVSSLVGLVRSSDIMDGVVRYSIDGHEYLSSGLLMSEAFWDTVAERFPEGAYAVIPTRESITLVDRRYRSALEGARSLIEIEQKDAVDLVSSLVYERVGSQLMAVWE